jgi:hypothetical protein
MLSRGDGEIFLLACTLGSAGIAGCGGGSTTGGDAGVQSDGGVTPEASLADVGTEAEVATKQGWLRSFASRLSWIATNPAAQKIALEAAERGLDKLLPPHT